jgi:hypothetical protein
MALPWSLFLDPLIVFALGVVLACVAVAVLWEYRRLFAGDPRQLMTAEVLMQLVTSSGGPGYLAAFLLAAALLSFASALIMAVLNVVSYLNA